MKIATIKLLYRVIFFCLLVNIVYAEPACLVISAGDSKEPRDAAVIAKRKVILVDKLFSVYKIQAYIPRNGKYQLFAYVHHNWRDAVPCIYVKATDSAGRVHKGYHKVESIWYLDKESPGRWFFVSLAQNPCWELPQGKLDIRFWAEAKSNPWLDSPVSMEKEIAIGDFFLMPIQDSGSGIYLPWLINPETGKGDWDIFDYHPLYGTNLIRSNKDGAAFSYTVNIPSPSYYRIFVSLLSPLKNNLKIILKRKTDEKEINFDLQGKDTWFLAGSGPLYLAEGAYSLTLRHYSQNELMIDYLILLPDSEKNAANSDKESKS